MIVKVVERRALVVADPDGVNAMATALGDQTTWIEGVLRAQIVEEVDAAPEEGVHSFFRHTHYFGVTVSREVYEGEVQRALQQGNVLPLPATRYRIVWLWCDGGNNEVADQLVLGAGVEAFLMTDDGRTIDRLR